MEKATVHQFVPYMTMNGIGMARVHLGDSVSVLLRTQRKRVQNVGNRSHATHCLVQ